MTDNPTAHVNTAAPGALNAPGAALCVTGLAKSFGPTQALRECTLELRPGDVHAIIGENGSGKSTLVKILSGVHRPDAGTIDRSGADAVAGSPLAERGDWRPASCHGLPGDPRRRPADRPREHLAGRRRPAPPPGADPEDERERRRGRSASSSTSRAARRRRSSRFRSAIGRRAASRARSCATRGSSSSTRPRRRSTSPRATACSRRAPAARRRGAAPLHLAPHGRGRGDRRPHHRPALRRGSRHAEPRRSHHRASSSRLMTGDEDAPAGIAAPTAAPRRRADAGLRAAGVRLHAGRGPIDVEIARRRARRRRGAGGPRPGPVPARRSRGRGRSRAAVACADGGRSATALAGGRAAAAASPTSRAIAAIGVDLRVALDPRELPAADASTRDRRHGLVRRAPAERRFERYVDTLKIAPASATHPITSLSGGNQQKVVIARWLAMEPAVLLLNDPTRGVDAGTKRDIYRVLTEPRREGVAVVMLSTEVDRAHRAHGPRARLPRGPALLASCSAPSSRARASWPATSGGTSTA